MQSTYEFSSEYLHDILQKLIERLKVDCTVDDIIYDLSVAISILVQDGTSYVFPHRSLQEYFAASYISHSREETKKHVYTVKFRDTDDTERITFWGLCEELDQSCFLQYFLIPSLKKYIEDLVRLNDKNLSRPENILFNYLKLTDTHIAKTTNNYFIYRGNARYSIIRYLGIQNSMTRKLFISFDRINEKDFFLFAKRGKFYFNNEDKSKGVMEFYERNGVFKAAEKHIEVLERIVKEKENLLVTMKDDSVAIMDLI